MARGYLHPFGMLDVLMRFFIEAEGVLLDQKSRFWHAYSQAAAHVGLARTDEGTFWRLVRTGADDDRYLQRAKDHHIKAFRAKFDESLTSAESLAMMTSHEDAANALIRLRRRGQCAFFSSALNGDTQIKPLIKSFAEAIKIDADAAQILPVEPMLAAARSEPAHAVLAAEFATVRQCESAGVRTIAIASGSAIAKRLAGAGAIAAYRDLEQFADAMDEGADELIKAGLVLANQR